MREVVGSKPEHSGSRQFQDSPRGGGHEEIAVQEGGLSDFTILFYFKEMCSLLSAVLNGT